MRRYAASASASRPASRSALASRMSGAEAGVALVLGDDMTRSGPGGFTAQRRRERPSIRQADLRRQRLQARRSLSPARHPPSTARPARSLPPRASRSTADPPPPPARAPRASPRRPPPPNAPPPPPGPPPSP